MWFLLSFVKRQENRTKPLLQVGGISDLWKFDCISIFFKEITKHIHALYPSFYRLLKLSSLFQNAGEVIGFDTNERAIDHAQKNSIRNGITNCQFFRGSAKVLLSELIPKAKFNNITAIVDPPRLGLCKYREKFTFISGWMIDHDFWSHEEWLVNRIDILCQIDCTHIPEYVVEWWCVMMYCWENFSS